MFCIIVFFFALACICFSQACLLTKITLCLKWQSVIYIKSFKSLPLPNIDDLFNAQKCTMQFLETIKKRKNIIIFMKVGFIAESSLNMKHLYSRRTPVAVFILLRMSGSVLHLSSFFLSSLHASIQVPRWQLTTAIFCCVFAFAQLLSCSHLQWVNEKLGLNDEEKI